MKSYRFLKMASERRRLGFLQGPALGSSKAITTHYALVKGKKGRVDLGRVPQVSRSILGSRGYLSYPSYRVTKH